MKNLLRSALSQAWAAPAALLADAPSLRPLPDGYAQQGAARGVPAMSTTLATPSLRRRRKLWELTVRMHCPLVGSCLSVVDMRRLLARNRLGLDERGLSDYELHVRVVSACSQRSALTEVLQRHLDKRHATAVTRSQQLRGDAALLAYWQEASRRGDDIAGALWACLTHVDLSDEAWAQIEGDVHMLSHQTGAAVRADLQLLARLQQENLELRAERDGLRRDLVQAQRQLVQGVEMLEQARTACQTQAAALAAREQVLSVARAQARDYGALQERSAQLAQQQTQLQALLREQVQRLEELQTEQAATRSELQAAEAALESLLGVCPSQAARHDSVAPCHQDCPPEVQLSGRCVLCIGGRANLVDGYRRLVETRGGRFMHHDGGQEENLRRLDTALISADAVVCQAGCVSHAAYWRLKDACKKLGKPCVFLKSPGVTSFARGLVDLADDVPGSAPGVVPH